MFGAKNQGAMRPTAMGSLLQASVYGATIPAGYGMTQSPLLAIWAANLRQGGSTKKFKQMKKGITAYCENIDFLLGHNPIMGVLQMMVNGTLYPLTFTSQSFSYSGAPSVTVTDSHFYFVIAVTLQCSYSFAVNDYGAQGPQTLSGSFEVPLWNAVENGPDPTDNAVTRNWPFCYHWKPGDGAVVRLDAGTQLPSGTLKVYYAQLMSATSYQPPISRLKLAFENQLGSGSEYADAPAPFNTQQIIYPQFAGMGSSEIDLGSGGVIPQMQPEVRFKWGIYPSGDADFADIIEDIFKSGLAQAAIGIDQNYTAMARGLSCYSLPGCVQKKTVGAAAFSYDRPVTAGNFLVVPYVSPTGTPVVASSIADTLGNTWTPVFADGLEYQVWWTKSIASGQDAVSIGGAIGGGSGGGSESLPPLATPPVPYPPPSGQSVAWSFPTASAVVDTAFGSAIANTPAREPGSGSAHQTWTTFAAPTPSAQAQWSNFAIPTLPPGAVVDSMAIVATPSKVSSPTMDSYGDFHAKNASLGSTWIWDVPLSTIDGSQKYSTTGIGTDPSVLPGFVVTALVQYRSGFGSSIDFEVDVADLAVAIYYHAPVGAQIAGLEVAGVDTFDTQATGITDPASLTTTNQQDFPAYVLNLGLGQAGAAAAPPSPRWGVALDQWNFNSNVTGAPSSPYLYALEKNVRSPGTVEVRQPLALGAQAYCALAFKATQPSPLSRPLGAFLDLPSLDLVRQQCRANGLWGSLAMTAQQAASDWLQVLYAAANAAPVYLGFRLFSFPYSEVSAAGNGALYAAPTAAGPAIALDADNGDFVGTDGTPKLTTGSRIELPNVLQMQCISREANYAQVVVQQPDAASIALYGERKADATVNNAVQDASIARQLLGIQQRRNRDAGDSWSFRLSPRHMLRHPMELVTLTDRLQGLVAVPVRLTSVQESDQGFDCIAEPFVYGMCAPSALPTTSPSSTPIDTQTPAGNINPPIIFEPVPRLCALQPQAQLWAVISSPSTEYGGCQPYVSTDGGLSYNPVGAPLLGSAITGALTTDWPAAADPDTANDLALDLTESNGVLQSYALSDEDNFVYPCYVDGSPLNIRNNGTLVAEISLDTVQNNGVTVAAADFRYELMSYATATLTGTHLYTLKATGAGNHLRRAVFNAPAAGAGCDHPLGRRWAFLSPAGTGILKINMDSTWIGQTLWFKFCTFNIFGNAIQSLTDAVAYSYTPNGVPYA